MQRQSTHSSNPLLCNLRPHTTPFARLSACLSVRGAAQGEGLGNAFLSHISAVDGIFHVCRAFEDPDVTHVEDRVDPVQVGGREGGRRVDTVHMVVF